MSTTEDDAQPRSAPRFVPTLTEVVAAAADPAVFADGHWDFRADNAALHTLHHLGAGNFARASDVIRARPL